MNNRLPSIYRVLILVVFGLIPFGQFERLQLSGFSALYLHELIIVMLTVIFSLSRIDLIFSQIKHSRFIHVLTLLNTWIVLTIALHAHQLSVFSSVLYLLRFDSYIGFGCILFWMCTQSLIKKVHIIRFLIIDITLIAILGIIQYVCIPDTRFLFYLGWDEHYFRLISTILDPGFTGILLAVGAVLLQPYLKFHFSTRKIQWANLLRMLPFITIFTALLLTYSRASFLAYGVGSILLYLQSKKKKHVFLIVLFMIGALVLPRPKSEGARLERTASVTSRFQSIQKTLALLKPIDYVFGKGWYFQKNTQTTLARGVPVPNHSSAPENSTIFILSTLGIVGLGIFSWLLVILYRITKHSSEYAIIFSMIFIHSLFTNTFFYPFVLLLLAILTVSSEV